MNKDEQNILLIKITVYLFFTILIAWVVYEPVFLLKIKDGIGILVGLFLIHTSIENKLLLRKSSIKCDNQEEVIKNLCKYCPDLIAVKDNKMKYQVCNGAMLEILGVDNTECVIGKTVDEFMSSKISAVVNKYDEMAIKRKRAVKYKITKNFKNLVKTFEIISAPMIVKDETTGVLSVARDITAKEELKRQLMEKQCHLASILDNLPFIAYLKDAKGRIIRGNSKLEEHVGLPFHKIMGQCPKNLFLVSPKECSTEEDKYIFENKTSLEIEKQLDMKSSGLGWYRITKAPILNEINEVTGITVLIENIDEERKIEAQKETFVATLTHDLKTPTIAQIRALELLMDNSFGDINSKQKEMLEQILKSCRYMLSMISHVLSTYKFENGEAKLRSAEFSFTKLIDECLNEMSHLAKDKNLNFELKTQVKDGMIYGDKIQLKRVVINILSNAISYAFDNTDVDIILEERENNISFCTVNKSAYIPSDILNRIFDKYVSGPSVKFNKVGTGLGLYLSERIINAHHGSIIAKSTKDNENTFGFIIPKTCISNKSLIEA